MLILNAEQIREWDLFTINNEPIASIDLMERAALACTDWLLDNLLPAHNRPVAVFCGKGNNGGDGLAIARMLYQRGFQVSVHIIEFGHLGTEDFQINLQRLHQTSVEIRFLSSEETFPDIESNCLVIDALYGSGLNRPLEGLTAALVQHINENAGQVISIDIPSGLFIDHSAKNNIIIRADHTLTFQCMKLAFMMPENESHIGKVSILDIKLHKDFQHKVNSNYEMTDDFLVRSIYKRRSLFSHKGTHGHALLIAGSYGKMGAAVLATRACLRTGAGLTSINIPSCGYDIIQTLCPEAMAIPDAYSTHLSTLIEGLDRFKSIGIGPGIGTAEETREMVFKLVSSYQGNIVADADGLNILSTDIKMLAGLNGRGILTPHPKEFSRLFGDSNNDFDRMELCRQKAREFGVIIILKGKFSAIVTPGGMVYFNATGNPGMAKGGTGDVLTGMLSALLAQGYRPEHAAILGCYLHGLAGDLASLEYGEEAMLATDLVEKIGHAYQQLISF